MNFQLLYFYFLLYSLGKLIIYLVFSEFTSKLMSLLASNNISVFFLVVCKFSHNILMSLALILLSWDFPNGRDVIVTIIIVNDV